MHSIVILDFETTGLDPAVERGVELGAILYSLAHRTVIEQFATLIRSDGNAAEGINKIPAAALLVARDAQHALNRLNDLVDTATLYGEPVFMAHRAEFDRGFLDAIGPRLVERAPWVCSKFDVEWPLSKLGSSCVEMALAHGVPVVDAHRALTDCTLIAKTIAAVQAGGVDVDALITSALRPKATFQANVSFDDREKAKAAGFRWDGATRRWLRAMAVEDTKELPFPVTQVAA